jgi:hypothetical protein
MEDGKCFLLDDFIGEFEQYQLNHAREGPHHLQRP